MFDENLLGDFIKQMLWSFFKFHWNLIQWKKCWKYDVRFIFNEESDFSEEKTSHKEDFRSTILQPFQFETEQKNRVVMRAMRKKHF